MLSIQNLYKFYGGNKILDNVSFQINPGEKTALVGVNGSGKTTLLKIIMGTEEYSSGSVSFPDYCQRAYLSQEITLVPENTLMEEMKTALPDILEIEKNMKILEDRMMRNGEEIDLLVERYARLQERFEFLEGRDLSWKIDIVIQGLGFSLADKERKVKEFSGGWQVRMELAKILLREVDLLLLDEPTNHLDMKAVEWMEEYLADYPSAVILVSHDRYFLNRVVRKTLHLDGGEIKTYTGNYDQFVRQYNQDLERQEQLYREQQKKMEKDLRFIERFRYKATLATRVKSREKMLERMEKVSAPRRENKNIHINFKENNTDMTTVYQIKELAKEYPGRTIPLNGEIEIAGGEKLAIVGDNGSGKTTLLKILSRVDKIYRGKLKIHDNARINYYSQDQNKELDPEKTVIEEAMNNAPSHLSDLDIRTVLGCFLLRDEDVFKKVGVLSGGEKARLALARIMMNSANVLLLDEPTNHLDIPSRDVLAESLLDFGGTVIIVSHDRYFIDQVCNRVIEIERGVLNNYPGNYSYYRDKKKTLEKRKDKEDTPEKRRNLLNPVVSGKVPKEEDPVRELNRKILHLEEEITLLENNILNIETRLETPQIMGDDEKRQESLKEYAEVKKLLEEKIGAWEELSLLL